MSERSPLRRRGVCDVAEVAVVDEVETVSGPVLALDLGERRKNRPNRTTRTSAPIANNQGRDTRPRSVEAGRTMLSALIAAWACHHLNIKTPWSPFLYGDQGMSL